MCKKDKSTSSAKWESQSKQQKMHKSWYLSLCGGLWQQKGITRDDPDRKWNLVGYKEKNAAHPDRRSLTTRVVKTVYLVKENWNPTTTHTKKRELKYICLRSPNVRVSIQSSHEKANAKEKGKMLHGGAFDDIVSTFIFRRYVLIFVSVFLLFRLFLFSIVCTPFNPISPLTIPCRSWSYQSILILHSSATGCSVDDVVREIDKELGKTPLCSSVVPQNWRESMVTKWFGEALPKSFASPIVVAEAEETSYNMFQ